MRPVNKGDDPDIIDGNGDFKKYQYARRFLIDRIGDYCSYCERKLVASLAVEHVEPKTLVSRLERKWDNFLLACTNCNSIKSDEPIVINDFLWPHKSNTFPLFKYNDEGLVESQGGVDSSTKTKIENMIKLTGLDKKGPKKNTNDYYQASDRRQENRLQALIESEECRLAYANQSDKESYRRILIKCVIHSGFFSIWMHAFKDYPEVQKALIDAFPGTKYKNEILAYLANI